MRRNLVRTYIDDEKSSQICERRYFTTQIDTEETLFPFFICKRKEKQTTKSFFRKMLIISRGVRCQKGHAATMGGASLFLGDPCFWVSKMTGGRLLPFFPYDDQSGVGQTQKESQ